MQKVLKSLLIGTLTLLAGVYFFTGTVSPCGLVKKTAKAQLFEAAVGNPSASGAERAGGAFGLTLAAPMLDNFVDSMSPLQCIRAYARMQLHGENIFAHDRNLPGIQEARASFSANPPPRNPPVWQVDSKKSPVDDSISVTISIEANDETSVGYSKHIPQLILRCQQNKTEAYVVMGGFLSTQGLPVTQRIDKDSPSTETWSISTDRKALFAPRPIAFIKSIVGRENLLIQTTPYGENPTKAIFHVAGLNNYIGSLQDACRWPSR